MPIIASDKLDSLMQTGKARIDRPGRFNAPEPPKEDKRLKTMQGVLSTLQTMAAKDDSGNTELLRSIEGLLKQLISLYSAPKPGPIVATVPAPRNKRSWKFNINRDGKGRLESIEAVPEQGE